MNIAIDGTTGSGKGTLARTLAQRLGLDGPFTSGEIMRAFAADAGMTLEDFQKKIGDDPQYDLHIEQRMRDISFTHDHAVFDGRITAFVCRASVRIYLDCPLDIRAARVAERDHQTYAEARAAIAFRDAHNAERYKKHYGITAGDPTPYNLFLNSATTTPEELAEFAMQQIARHPHLFQESRGTDPQELMNMKHA